jgi:hypothetical protein
MDASEASPPQPVVVVAAAVATTTATVLCLLLRLLEFLLAVVYARLSRQTNILAIVIKISYELGSLF